MKVVRSLMTSLPFLLAVPIVAQPQIGGGICSSATLSGTYSATLTGRNLGTTVVFLNASQQIGSVTFDGLSAVTFTLSGNTEKTAGLAQTLSGTYSLQANCIGVINITTGDTATFTLESYNQGKDYLLTGEDGTLAFAGNGGLLPATCPTAIPAGTYAFNGSGFGLTSNSISTVLNISGLLQFSGPNTITVTEAMTTATGFKNISATGTYTVGTGCVATATVTDASGNIYTMTFELTSAAGNFLFTSANPSNIFSGTGRPL